MSWFKPLIELLWHHFEMEHGDFNDPFVLYGEKEMLEEHLIYTRFEHGDLEHINCPFVGCQWQQAFTINYDLLVKSDLKEMEE